LLGNEAKHFVDRATVRSTLSDPLDQLVVFGIGQTKLAVAHPRLAEESVDLLEGCGFVLHLWGIFTQQWGICKDLFHPGIPRGISLAFRMNENAPPKVKSPVALALIAFMQRTGQSGRKISLAVGDNDSLVKSILKGKSINPRSDTLTKLSTYTGIPMAELTGETKQSFNAPKPNAVRLSTSPAPTVRDLPVYGAAEGGDGVMILDNEPIEYKDRPANLVGVRGAYAVYIINDSMAPAYEQGDQVNIHPARPVKPGKDALFISTDEHGTEHAMVKRLVRATDKVWRVQQFNPPKNFDLPRNVWQRALRVVGCDKSD
jgi:phage repressor protein C with HTH and peptisase S24 domain